MTKNSNEYIMYITSDPWVLKVQRRTTVKRRLLLTSLRERLYESLKEDILTNRFKPGEELQINKLAEEFTLALPQCAKPWSVWKGLGWWY